MRDTGSAGAEVEDAERTQLWMQAVPPLQFASVRVGRVVAAADGRRTHIRTANTVYKYKWCLGLKGDAL